MKEQEKERARETPEEFAERTQLESRAAELVRDIFHKYGSIKRLCEDTVELTKKLEGTCGNLESRLKTRDELWRKERREAKRALKDLREETERLKTEEERARESKNKRHKPEPGPPKVGELTAIARTLRAKHWVHPTDKQLWQDLEFKERPADAETNQDFIKYVGILKTLKDFKTLKALGEWQEPAPQEATPALHNKDLDAVIARAVTDSQKLRKSAGSGKIATRSVPVISLVEDGTKGGADDSTSCGEPPKKSLKKVAFEGEVNSQQDKRKLKEREQQLLKTAELRVSVHQTKITENLTHSERAKEDVKRKRAALLEELRKLEESQLDETGPEGDKNSLREVDFGVGGEAGGKAADGESTEEESDPISDLIGTGRN